MSNSRIDHAFQEQEGVGGTAAAETRYRHPSLFLPLPRWNRPPRKISIACPICSSVTDGLRERAEAPCWTSAGVLGMTADDGRAFGERSRECGE